MTQALEVQVLKADGTKELFNREKLLESLARANATPEIRDKIVTHIEAELINNMSTSDIYRHAFSLLDKFQKPAATRYSLRRALVGFGPTGFPFEDYIGEIFRTLGYQTETGKMILGKCVEHEVDLVAYNDSKLVMGEIKFHNELGYKTDLKVALYVKARIDDLQATDIFIGGKNRKLEEGWLITNTKFSSGAIQYGECAGLKLLGWNYPRKGHLQDLIEGSNLHPVSCLTTLNNAHKTELFGKGVVLCKSLKENDELLRNMGLSDSKLHEIREEITMLC